MSWVIKFAKSSIGAKSLMAVTGLALFGFVLIHMLGNLQIFLGRDAINDYAAFLQGKAELLWGARLVLLAAVGLHIVSGVRLNLLNSAARPVPYVSKRYTKASWTSRTMVLSGLTVLAFILFHLAHFTAGLVQPQFYHLTDDLGRHDVYSMFVHGFQNTWIATSYVVAMLLLGMHLNHGASSMLQSLGLNHPRYNGALQRFGPVFAAIIVAGNLSMPIAVQLGLIRLPPGVM